MPLFLEIKPELPVKLANRFCSIDLQGRVKVRINYVSFKTGLGSRNRSRVFLAPWSRSRLKKKQGAGAAWKKSQKPEPEPEKNLPAPQPCFKILNFIFFFIKFDCFFTQIKVKNNKLGRYVVYAYMFVYTLICRCTLHRHSLDSLKRFNNIFSAVVI